MPGKGLRLKKRARIFIALGYSRDASKLRDFSVINKKNSHGEADVQPRIAIKAGQRQILR